MILTGADPGFWNGGWNFCNNGIEPKPGWGVWGLCISMIEEGLWKRGGGRWKFTHFTSPGSRACLNRKWSPESTANDSVKWIEEWNGFYATAYKKGLIIKRNLFLPTTSKEKGKEDATSQLNLYKAKKMEQIWKGYDINHLLLSLSIASNFFQECFVSVKI